MQRLIFSMTAILCAACAASAVRADLIVEVGDALIEPGELGEVNVYVRSTTGTDSLALFNTELIMSQLSGAGVKFANPIVDAHLNTPAYFFNSDSVAELFPPSGTISTTNTLDDTYFGGDGTLSGNGMLVPTSNVLLLTLTVDATDAAPNSRFRVDMTVPDGVINGFWDEFFSPLAIDMLNSNFSGTVQITPEPKGCSVFALVGAICVGAWFCRQRSLVSIQID